MTAEELRNSLGSMLWKAATDLVHTGKVNPVQFKDFMLGGLFYRFISEDITYYCNDIMRKSGVAQPDYAKMTDKEAEIGRKQIVSAKGFFLLPSQLFINVANKAKNDENLNTTLANVFRNFEHSAMNEASEPDVKGLFDNFNTNDPRLGATVAERCEVLTILLETIRDFDFAQYISSGLDVFGICYEYLIKMYALNSGTKGGEFYTPAEVSFLLAKIAACGRTSVNKVYDPACGSGSLLLKFKELLGAENVTQGFFGQEINIETYNLCRMNMFLHNINYYDFNIQQGDTLIEPKHTNEEPFDAIVSNPPYATPWEGKNNVTLINDPRFSPAGVLAPSSKADLAFVMHILSWLSAEGTAAIVEFPGVLYRGSAEEKIRKYLVSNNYVDAVIQLPDNLFFGTSIATCIIVLKKNKSNNKVIFIDASREFVHKGNKNKLSADNIEKIYQTQYNKKEEQYFSKIVSIADIQAQKYNLSVSTYVEKEDTTEEIDIDQLNQRITEIVARQSVLRAEIDELVKQL
ncbi:MAG: type I restriction-modification system subunit M [Bacteroidales bacterium]|nr:type I restriction-modification system subunit M [Bacteroidales bacterium]